jgi:mannose-1-phosphate guanylyltransferase
MTTQKNHLWTIVLAAGDGTRLRPLTRALHGEDLPKQFAIIQGRSSLLQTTVARAEQWSQPEHIVVIVAEDRQRLAREQLAHVKGVQIVVQPHNLGTGPGILLPLRAVLAQDRRARVVVLPSDHYVRDEVVFEQAIRRGDAAARRASSVVLLGAVPEKAEDQYGWIMPSFDAATGRVLVSAFREKPHPDVARELARAGALWSTFVMVAGARDLWDLASEGLPAQAALFERYAAAFGCSRATSVLLDIYSKMSPADFSRNVLERAQNLEVISLPPCGWSDWGTPERVLESLRGTPDHDRLSMRLRESSVAA